jgi:methylenetetrahydrofolate dehydrogenase (NADP+)/methenyltetrahydrofolate cyclohydrolase
VFERISPKKDVDGFHPQNMGKVMLDVQDENALQPATPAGIMYMLQHYGVELNKKNAVVVGRSNTVGKPMAMLLLHRNATVTICHTHTTDLAEHTRKADVLVVAAGVPGLIKADMVKEGATVIDVGTTNTKGADGRDRLAGDVDFESVIKKADCSPVPGGVGPMTVAMLIANTVKAAKRKRTR